MKVALFDTHHFEQPIFESINKQLSCPNEIVYFDFRLTQDTAAVAEGFPAVCAFVNDRLDKFVIEKLAKKGLKLLALRSAGFNHVDLAACKENSVVVLRVPAYSPNAVAEHALSLILVLNRKIHRAYNRVRELNFSLDGLVGFDLYEKTVGIIGTGRIGSVLARAMHGLGCKVVAYDTVVNKDLVDSYGVKYISKQSLFEVSDVISLHIPLTPDTRHTIDATALSLMKKGVMLINTGRGALIDAKALVASLKNGHLGSAGLDVYEEEEGVFFLDLSNQVLQDDTLARLLTFPNVIITAHQGFLTKEAHRNIAETTLDNISNFKSGSALVNEVRA